MFTSRICFLNATLAFLALRVRAIMCYHVLSHAMYRLLQHGSEGSGDLRVCARQPRLCEVLRRVLGRSDPADVRGDLHRMAGIRHQYLGKSAAVVRSPRQGVLTWCTCIDEFESARDEVPIPRYF